ncbi:hypothetical protein IAQ61_003400 [Plenodomus lingam]|uniref:uncharacterized protein n=1 Tax=Leptosphaeria maculans TaxID=5022 RepID=UPI003322BA7B|nr:hypothetical protein IAQ61_003400 [Plenodomus lingam]
MRLDRDWSDLAFTCKNCYVGMRQDAENCFKERLNRLSRASHRANARCTVKAIISIQHVFLARQRITIAIGGGITGFKDTTSSANLDHLTHILAVDVKMCRLIMSPFAKDIPRHCYVGSVILVYRPLRELESIASAFSDRQPKVQVD